MEQKKMLVELIKKARREWLSKEYDRETEKTVDEYVADYLIENNVVVFSLKCGSTVWFIDEWTDNEAIEGSIVSYSAEAKGIWFYCRYLCGLTMWHKIEDLGVKVFLSKADAEKMLNDARNEHGN